jgi:hypothetical protein
LVEEDANVVAGHQRIRLLVHPRVGPVDAREVTEAFLSMARASGPLIDAMWQDPPWFSVERQVPHETVDGKVHHVHRMTRVGASDSRDVSGRVS